uniref:Uncharacterized protein n=1 Tax=Pithovirus LCPAC101 TaxID=2506586 RepID=A0A481Z271_9VIRU|nr:MAG: uncharacterized protein LCPAC101_01150 [Pithovirus LCPAC101]
MENTYSKIETLYIATTLNGTKIENFNTNTIDPKSTHKIYSVIEIVPDESRTTIKTIKGLYNYGPRMNDKYRCSFDLMESSNNPVLLMNGHGNTLIQKIRSYFNTILMNSSHNEVMLKGLKYPGISEQQKFVNAFCSGVAVTLSVYNFLKQVNPSNDSLVSSNPFYPLNLCFNNHNININLLNKNFYHYIAYYIHVCKDKFGSTMSGIAVHWLNEMNNFWMLFGDIFYDAEPTDNLMAVHASTMGFASFFEDRVHNSWIKIGEETSKSISLIKGNSDALTDELKETHKGYYHTLKTQSNKIEGIYSDYARKLSSKFTDFNDFVDDAATQYQQGMEEVKNDLRGHIEKNKEELIEDIAKTWNSQLDDISKLTKAIKSDIDKQTKQSVTIIESSSSAMVDTALVRIRSEVDSILDDIKIIHKKITEDLRNIQINSKSEISAKMKKVEHEVSMIAGDIESGRESLMKFIDGKENDQLNAADSLLTFIGESKEEFRSIADDAKNEMKEMTQSIVNDEFHSMVQDQGKDLVEESFVDSFDNLIPMLNSKINDTLNEQLNPLIRNTIRQVNDIKREFDNISNEKINTITQMKEFITEHENKVPSYDMIQKIQDEWNTEKIRMVEEKEQWSSYIEGLSKEIESLKKQLNDKE